MRHWLRQITAVHLRLILAVGRQRHLIRSDRWEETIARVAIIVRLHSVGLLIAIERAHSRRLHQVRVLLGILNFFTELV